ncbi:zinc finger CCCH domain-containing protein 18-like isoform X2 [Punica granatum]|uniref:Zinc finger CCCH domain-containing protein 18-like isoform X2 n=2 Tax=Punica granatum TaxID=22663 RepID=A0A218XM13_PUNGR|nr:zinc finger CCCH domain-containing protein 18-like isoform X2 [Punica granatum]OWM85830.1 hypothetical protein CDL15_Pgr012080 [Punica granatum]
MNVLNPTGIVYSRINKLEPEHVTKIMGYLLYQMPSDQDMSLLALAPDKLMQDIVSAAKIDLQLHKKPASPPVSAPVTSLRHVAGPQFNHRHVPSPYQQFYAKKQSDYAVPYLEHQGQAQNQFLSLDDQAEKVALGRMEFPVEYLYQKDLERQLNGRVINRRYSNVNEYPTKTCHYFSRGYCRHGNNCRYLHGQASPDGFSPMLGPFLHDGVHDQILGQGSLNKLQLEIVEILKSRRGNPLSIASLPMIYYERYGKVLQAEGYLTESQRNGKAGHSLTRLLSRLSEIKLIDRPHGQHAVILAEDAPKYPEGRNEGTLINSKSKQIYLTFPAESTFTEEDVSNYFSTYGPVEDVRIPCQHKRMFGFVTFVDSETVQTILAKGNPHYVCGARVLVKPYKEKSKLIHRKYQEKIELHHIQPYVDADSELHSMQRSSETLTLLRYHQKFMEEQQEQALELERRSYAQQQLMRKDYQQQSYLINSFNGLKISEDRSNIPSANFFNPLVDVLNGNSAEGNKLSPIKTINPDEERDMLNLPDSPFASSIINSITNLIS